MKQILICLISAISLLLILPKSAIAYEDPLNFPNNHFGIHIFDENDLEKAAELVNGNGGEWGYITLVIREDERQIDRWQEALDNMKKLKLIPIVRLATINQNGIWQKPNSSEAKNWAEFLNALSWPVQNRYIILFNEPNHAKEWGGQVNPEEYATIAKTYWQEIKKADENFFVLPAALDLAAPNGETTLSPEEFYKRMHETNPLIFTIFDGINSHSYPNPAFSAPPEETGKTSIQGFKWEISFLKDFDLYPNLPIFITETGWSKENLSSEKIAEYYKKALEVAWNDNRIVAITPFILNYESYPFNDFSWIKKDDKSEPFYDLIKNHEKISGKPPVLNEKNSTIGFNLK